MHQIGTRVKQTEGGRGVSNLDSFAEFPLKYGFGGWQSFHSTPVFLPKLLFWSVPEKYYFQFSPRKCIQWPEHEDWKSDTTNRTHFSFLHSYTLLITHAPTAKNKYEQLASRIPVSHLVWVTATCIVCKMCIVTIFWESFIFKRRK